MIDFSFWKLTLPTDENEDDKVDEVSVSGMQNFVHDDYFYVDENGWVVFAARNKAATTSCTIK